MRPKSLSASALNVAELCLSRYHAEQIERSRGIGGGAASLGSSVHGALEMIVKHTKLDGNVKDYTLKFLLECYRMSYMTVFDTADTSGAAYDDGVEMLTNWFERTSWEGVLKVISVESKTNFPLKTSIGEIPFNYIWDRCDQLGENEYKVVDYKTNRWDITPQDLKKKIQARAYGLAAQIQFPEAERIWVEFDMLRHGPRGIVYKREDNVATWKFLKESAERIIAAPDDTPTETLNPECRFCIRKQSCNALKRNIRVGGLFSISSPSETVDQRALLEYQKSALESAIRELDEIILQEAKTSDVFEFESENNRMSIGVSSRRSVDPERIQQIVGDDVFSRYGSTSLTITNVDKMLKSRDLTDAQKRAVRSMIYQKKGEPRVSVSAKGALDGED